MKDELTIVDKGGRESKVDPELVTILFGSAIENGVTEVTWEDLPKLVGKLEQAGFTVRGEMVTSDFDKLPVISVELKIRVKGIRSSPRDV